MYIVFIYPLSYIFHFIFKQLKFLFYVQNLLFNCYIFKFYFETFST